MKLLLIVPALLAAVLAAPAADADADAIADPSYNPQPPNYKPCGGRSGIKCPRGQVCIDNPRGCSQAVDCNGICVKPRFCGGFAAIRCPKPLLCVDDPRDGCDPNAGGADCGGLCA